MAIKVKHEGNVTSRLVAAAKGGRGKRQAEDAKWLAQLAAQENMASMRDTRGGGAAPLTHANANAQLGHAPTMGAPSGIHAPVGRTTPITGAGARAGVSAANAPRTMQQPAQVGPAARTPRTVSRTASVAPIAESDYKVTGTSIFNRPDEESQWDPGNGGRWIRPWLPGEKEAEALRRTGEVQNDLVAERELTAQGRRERAALVNDVVDAIKQGRFSREEMPKLLERFGDAEDTIRMADALREREPTAQEQLDKRRVILDGIPGIYDSKGNFVPSSSFRDTSEQKQMDYDLRREELAAKRLDSQRTNANKMITDLMKPVKTGKDNRGNDTFRAMSYEEALEIAKKAYPDVYNPPAASQEAPAGSGMADPVIAARTDAPVPTTEATAEPTPTEDDDEFAKFRRK